MVSYDRIRTMNEKVTATSFYVTFFVLNFFVMSNMFIAIITNAYQKVERNTRDEPLDDLGAQV